MGSIAGVIRDGRFVGDGRLGRGAGRERREVCAGHCRLVLYCGIFMETKDIVFISSDQILGNGWQLRAIAGLGFC